MKSVAVHVTNLFEQKALPAAAIKRLVRSVCRQFRLSAAVVSVVIVNDRQIRRLNKRFLRRDRITDCLSFDLSEPRNRSAPVFEIVVNFQKAARQARRRRLSTKAELALYIVHGLLHNLGFDDSTTARAAKMHAMEDTILDSLGFGRVYHPAIAERWKTAPPLNPAK